MYALPFILLNRIRQAAIRARRRDRSWHYLAWSALAGFATGMMLVIATSFILLLWAVGLWFLGVAMLAILILPMIADATIRHACVPLGWHRTAYYLGLFGRNGQDPRAYGLCAAAWAATPIGASWVERARDQRQPMGDAEVAATGFLAAGRGDVETARQLLRSISLIVEDHPIVRELAGEWLACDAAERGAWRELADDALAARWPASPLTYLLEGVALRRVAADGAPAASELWARWALAPRRRATRPLVEAALAATPPAPTAPAAADPSEPSEPAIAPDAAPLPRAVTAHLAFEAKAPTASRLAWTVRAWDAALTDPATRAWLARRANELDAPLGAADRALRDVTGVVTDDLARIADAAQLGAPAARGPVADALTRRLRHGRLDALETGFTRWSDRRHAGESHAAIDEWREFIALRASYTAAITAGGLELRRLAFPHAFSKGSNMAAWLWNARNEYALSHAISRWLLDEALAVGDTEAIELGHRNCMLAIPTRLGKIQP